MGKGYALMMVASLAGAVYFYNVNALYSLLLLVFFIVGIRNWQGNF